MDLCLPMCSKNFWDIGGYYEYDGRALHMQSKSCVSVISDTPPLSSVNHANARAHHFISYFKSNDHILSALISKRLKLLCSGLSHLKDLFERY